MNNGDIFLKKDGRMYMLLSDDSKVMKEVLFMDEDESTFMVRQNSPSPDENLGSDPYIVATFYAMRSVHLRLNRLSKV